MREESILGICIAIDKQCTNHRLDDLTTRSCEPLNWATCEEVLKDNKYPEKIMSKANPRRAKSLPTFSKFITLRFPINSMRLAFKDEIVHL